MGGSNSSRGIAYLAFGARCREEVKRSIVSVRKHSPNMPIAVITESAWSEEPLPDHFVVREGVASFGVKPEFLFSATPFDRTVAIDTDTVLGRDLSPVFDLLDHYEFCVRFVGPETVGEAGLRFHPYASSGMILFRKTEAVRRLFALWLEAYGVACQASGDAGRGGVQADRYLTAAIARSGARVMHLPEYVMFNLCEPSITYSAPVVCHGRLRHMERVAAYLQTLWRPVRPGRPVQRLWLPNIRGILPNGVRRSDPLLALSLCVRRLLSMLRYTFGRSGEKRS